MAMSPEVQEEYDRALKTATIANGGVVDLKASYYGWQDYEATTHLRGCGGDSTQDVDEDCWSEFAGTFAPEEEGHKQGLTLAGVNCSCGLLVDRRVRWDAGRSEIGEAVFEVVFGPKRR